MSGNVGIIGLGVIGYGMASNLRKRLPASTTLHICDISSASCQRLINEFGSYGKIQVASSPKELASSCQAMLSSLPSSASVRQVYLNTETGVIAAPKDPERLIIECSTIEIETTQEIGRTIMDAGIGEFVDATVSGGAYGAKAGTLSFMVGHPDPSDSDVVGKGILDVLSLVGVPKTIQFCGGLGMGQVAKIAHNYVCIANLLVATEGMALGMKYGIDKKALWRCMTDGAANSWVMHFEQPVPNLVDDAPSSHAYNRAFAAVLGLKDLNIAINAAKKVGLNPVTGEAALRAFQKVHDDPRTRDLDHTSIWLHTNDVLDDYFSTSSDSAEEQKRKDKLRAYGFD